MKSRKFKTIDAKEIMEQGNIPFRELLDQNPTPDLVELWYDDKELVVVGRRDDNYRIFRKSCEIHPDVLSFLNKTAFLKEVGKEYIYSLNVYEQDRLKEIIAGIEAKTTKTIRRLEAKKNKTVKRCENQIREIKTAFGIKNKIVFSTINELCENIYPGCQIIEQYHKGSSMETMFLLVKTKDDIFEEIQYHKCSFCNIVKGSPNKKERDPSALFRGISGYYYYCSICDTYIN